MAIIENIHTRNTKQTEQAICAVINIYICIYYIYVTTITKRKGSHEFEREQVYVWRKEIRKEESKKGNDEIILILKTKEIIVKPKYIFKKNLLGLGGDFLGKTLAAQARGFEFEDQEPRYMQMW